MSLLNYSGPLTPDAYPVQMVSCSCGLPLLRIAAPTGYGLIVGFNHGYPHPLIFTDAQVTEEDANPDDFVFEVQGKTYSWCSHATATETAYVLTCSSCGQSRSFLKTQDGGILLTQSDVTESTLPIPQETLPLMVEPLPEWDVE